MKMDDSTMLCPPPAGVSPEVYQQIGHLTRLLHDTLEQMGVMPHLQIAADNLPDARSRLNYVARKTGEAAEKVLNSVDQAKAEHEKISRETRAMAQDFHDLTGQVVAKVVKLAGDLEDSLVKLLIQVAPPEQVRQLDPETLNGPVVDPSSRTDVVANQGEVDDLLASLGF